MIVISGDLLRRLTETNGLPGYEDDVRDIIIGEIKEHVDRYWVDRLGNLVAVKNEGGAGRKIGLSAHMDEVGLVVKGINGDGTLAFASWGVDAGVLGACSVRVGQGGIRGVVGVNAGLGDDKALEIAKQFIDIGCKTKEEAEKLVSVGDYVAFDSNYVEFGKDNGKVKVKALDDRVGCAILIRLLKNDYAGQITAVFCVQEEIGTRGSMAAARQIDADVVINVEGTLCMDVFGVEEHQRVTRQGKGAAVYLADGYSVYNRELIDGLTAAGDRDGIPYQFRETKAGGTDSVNYHGENMRVIGVGIPCRYLHSAVSVMDKRDYENGYRLIDAYIKQN